MKQKPKHDFSGYVTKANLKCSDGRIILPDAFKHMDGQTVPLVWRHGHESTDNVLGHVLLENRKDGVYGFGFFNSTKSGQNAKELVKHGDINSLSIYANSLIEKALRVAHGVIREVSLVMSGANPGAKIDFVAIQHGDGTITEMDDEAVIYTGELLHEEEVEDLSHAEDDEEETDEETVEEVFNTLSEKQKEAVYAIVGAVVEGDGEDNEEEMAQSDDDEKGDSKVMKRNVFDAAGNPVLERKVLSHDEMNTIFETAKKVGSLKQAILVHAGDYGIDNIDYLFPDARNVTDTPSWVSRDMAWVSKVLDAARHSPFSRIKSLHADITEAEARARGYVKGNLKVEEVFGILRRITTPTTVYKKQKLDRDDILDITDFDVVAWLKAEMYVMIREELARAVLVGDGRSSMSDDKISATNLRPVWADDSVYVTHKLVPFAATVDDLIDQVIAARVDYRGSGTPSLYVAPSLATSWLLLRDQDGRRLYRTLPDLAAEMSVKEIVEVPVMEGLTREVSAEDRVLRAIMVNLQDYTIGADKGGQLNFFDDFDIDYNQEKYLLETRVSGAMIVPSGAVVLEQEAEA